MRTLSARSLVLISALSILSAAAHAKRPRDPWVFRGSLEGRSGTVFLALHTHLTAAYDTAGCGLLLAWKGAAVLELGPSPAGMGPEYRAAGAVYHRRGNPLPWSMRGPKGNVPVTVRLAFAGTDGENARLEYVLSIPGGASVKVAEMPEFDDHYGDNALFRNFEVTGLPAGFSLRLELGGRGMAETWGGGAVGRIEREGERVFLIQELDGVTPLKVTWSPRGDSEKIR